MDKLQTCRICLVKNVRMDVVNKNLREIYEKLTDTPFVTEDHRPILVCFFCCAKLKQCFRLMTKCLEAEEQFSHMMNEDYEPNPSMNIDHIEFCTGFSKSAIEIISVVDGCLTKSIAVKEESAAICGRQDDIIEPKEEYRSNDLEPDNLHSTSQVIEDIPPQLSDTEDNEPLIEFITDVEKWQETINKKLRAAKTNRAAVEKEQKLDTRGKIPGNTIEAELNKNKKTNLKLTRPNVNRTTKLGTEEIPSQSESHSESDGTFIEEEEQVVTKKRRSVRTNRAPDTKKPKLDTRRTKLKDTITAELKKNIQKTKNWAAVSKDAKLDTRKETGNIIAVELNKTKKTSLKVTQTNVNATKLGTEEIPPQFESNSESDGTFMEEEELEVKKKRRSVRTNRAAVRKETKLNTRKKTGNAPELNKNKRTKRGTEERGTEEIPPQSESNSEIYVTFREEEELEVKKKRRAVRTNRPSVTKKPRLEFRSTKPKDKIIAQQSVTLVLLRPSVTKKPRLEFRSTKPKDKIIAQLKKKEQSNLKENKCDQRSCEKTYECDICQRSFRRKDTLLCHMRIHTGEKPYKCDICERSFSTTYSFTNHTRTHTGEKPYKCHICQRCFGFKQNLTTHVRIHTGEKPNTCDICQRSFGTPYSYKRHIRIHTGEKPYKCDICERSFSTTYGFTNHARKHTGEKPYKCQICQRCFGFKHNLTTHVRIHTGEKPNTCDICQCSFRQKGQLICHMRVHTGEKPYKCNVCQRGFSEKGQLVKHIRIHTGEKPYTCDVCQRSFRERSGYRKHIRIHTGERPYTCDVCQRTFIQKNCLRNHILLHSGNKFFKCDKCNRSYNQKGDLTRHNRLHTGETYKCKECNRSFISNGELKRHFRLHTGERPFKCKECDRSFIDKGYLNKHIRVHTGEKPYTCDVCQRSFSQNSDLRSHLRKHTGEKPYECDVCQRRFSLKSCLRVHITRIHSDDRKKNLNPNKKSKTVAHGCAK